MRDENQNKKTYEVTLPEALVRSLAALPRERQAAFQEQVVKLAALFVNENPILDFRDVRLEDLDREGVGCDKSENPLMTLVLAEARMLWQSRRAVEDTKVCLLS